MMPMPKERFKFSTFARTNDRLLWGVGMGGLIFCRSLVDPHFPFTKTKSNQLQLAKSFSSKKQIELGNVRTILVLVYVQTTLYHPRYKVLLFKAIIVVYRMFL
mmetsp:Transcript_32862/g.48944  ORF Transcript_32862/g.48944 Transcript_32862/m.48944 type:complete len:103 (+) Transcript_32862:354-662(+)